MSNRTIAIALGVAVLGSAVLAGARDITEAVTHWARLAPLPPGQPAPEFRLYGLAGGEIRGDDLEGSVAVMTFWATWCRVCRGELEDLDELDDEYADREDVRFLAVNHEGRGLNRSQTTAVVRGYQRATGLGLPCALDDGSASRAFGVGAIPHTVVFDREGTIRFVHQGRVTASTIRDEVDRLLQGE